MGNSYGVGFFKELVPYLKKIPSIEILNLNDIFGQRNEELQECITILSEGIINKGVRAIDISNNALSINGSVALSLIIRQLSDLEYFWANSSGLAQNGSQPLAEALIEGKISLKLLSLTGNRIEEKAAKIGEAVSKMKNLETLIMSQNGIFDEPMTVLLSSCEDLTELSELNVNDNWIKEKAIYKLANIIRKNKSLKKLNCSDCNIEGDSNKIIAQAVSDSGCPWEEFYYQYNELGEEDPDVVLQLIRGLNKKGSLKKVDLEGNGLEENLDIKNYLESLEVDFVIAEDLSYVSVDQQREQELEQERVLEFLKNLQ